MYLDSAGTAQKPRRVIDAVTDGLAVQTANPGGEPILVEPGGRVAEARGRTARWISAGSADEIVVGFLAQAGTTRPAWRAA